MRLLQLHIITEYKNLKNFTINFDGNNVIDVFVGKNGTGKSNLFEAIIEIFRHLFDPEYQILFDYFIKYEINGQENHIKWEKGKFQEDINIEDVRKNLLPDNIIIYYSGHNEKVAELVSEYENNFKTKIKDAKLEDSRTFIGIGKDYKSLLLAVLLLQNTDNAAKKYLVEKLGIKTISQEIKIILKRPKYAIGKKDFDVDRVDTKTAFWKADGIVGDFLKNLSHVKKSGDALNKVREEGYFLREKDKDEYILYFDIESFQEKFRTSTSLDLFRHFDNLKTIEMLKEISIEITLHDNTSANIKNFSDGQFQTIYIYSIIEIFKGKNCLTILDEPDAFLHPEWQYNFLLQVLEINEDQLKGNHVLLSSHSPVTLIQSEGKKVNFFNVNNNQLRVDKVDKAYAISQLSSKLIKLQADKQILSIIHTLGQNKPILFTEGISDPIILKHAFESLYETNEMPFEICFGHGCLYLRLLLQNEKFLKEMNGKAIFGLFDFDEAYKEWNSITTNKGLIESDFRKGLVRQHNDFASYAILMPVPKNPAISRQVLKKNGTSFEASSKLEMEHIFYSEETKEYFHEVEVVGGSKIIEINDSQKMKFSTEVVPKLNKEDFEILRPIFDFIISKITLFKPDANLPE